MTPGREEMDRICQRIQTEKEPHVSTDLVQQLNDLLERKEKRLEITTPSYQLPMEALPVSDRACNRTCPRG
jgi:hypothetical protein